MTRKGVGTVLVGTCAQCGAPATLRCAMCARTLCRVHLDGDERLCPECLRLHKKQKGPTGIPLPPSRRTFRPSSGLTDR